MPRVRTGPPRPAHVPPADASGEQLLAKIFGANLRRVRENQRFSIERLSRAVGAPPSRLAKIEEGRLAPTLDLAWKIAEALDVSFAALAAGRPGPPPLSLVRAGRGNVVAASRGSSTRALFALGHPTRAELYELTLAAGSTRKSEPRAPGTVEKIVVHSGVLEILLDGEIVRLGARDAATLHAGLRHAYRNPGRSRAIAFVVLSHPQKA